MSTQSVVSELLHSAYANALMRYKDLHTEFAQLQHRLPIPCDNAAINTQAIGQFDFIIRCLEDEIAEARQNQTSLEMRFPMILNIQMSWSELWIIGLYEILRSAKEYNRNFVDLDLFQRVESVRIPLAKYQIAKDRALQAPLYFLSVGNTYSAERLEKYDKSDAQRSYTVSRASSARGSFMWKVLVTKPDPREIWIERREISDSFVEFLRKLPSRT